MKPKHTIAAWLLAASLAPAGCRPAAGPAAPPSFIETDSATAIAARTMADFSLDRPTLDSLLAVAYPGITTAEIDSFIGAHLIESKTIGDHVRFHRKAVRNLALLRQAREDTAFCRGSGASAARISYADSVLSHYRGTNPAGLSHAVRYRFTIEVPGNEALEGDTLRVWMPLPLGEDRSSRQHDVEILAASHPRHILSGARSVHNSIYFEAPAPSHGDTARFWYECRFVTSGAWMPEADILARLRPYDKTGDTYRRYTRLPDGPHIVRLDSLARAIAGGETNPWRCSEKVFDYITRHYPWAGAREYSTIECIPRYVVEEGHGDCGQVSLLYISLMRTLGIPARWESGWMLHPGEKNLHDWAEVYYEGIGWLPVDVSFGRYTSAAHPEIQGFYSHGTDSHRLAANQGVGGQLYPPKRYVRSETVDFQTGEVECGAGNLYYPAWSYSLEILSQQPVDQPAQ